MFTKSGGIDFGACKIPGMKVRSKGLGRGLARGRGRGPIGIPYRAKRKLPLRPGGGLVLSRRRDFGMGFGNYKNVGF